MSAGGYGATSYLCTCGKVVTGNGAKASHRRKCGDGHRYATAVEAYALRSLAAEVGA